MLGQVFRFALVGGMATLLHMLVGVTLIDAGWPALWANAISFLIAFLVSFTGHYGFSFPEQPASLTTSLVRYVLVACGGFAANETLLGLFIWFDMGSDISGLILSTGLAAVLTFFLSRSWAFRGASPVTID